MFAISGPLVHFGTQVQFYRFPVEVSNDIEYTASKEQLGTVPVISSYFIRFQPVKQGVKVRPPSSNSGPMFVSLGSRLTFEMPLNTQPMDS